MKIFKLEVSAQKTLMAVCVDEAVGVSLLLLTVLELERWTQMQYLSRSLSTRA
jgi:hypothetical protein